MKYKYLLLGITFFLMTIKVSSQRQIAITIDDPNTKDTYRLDWQERDNAILKTLDDHNLKVALFVCGMRVDNPNGKTLLNKWDEKGHKICNHTYSHFNYNSKTKTSDIFITDFNRGDSIIRNYNNYTKLFRFPYLKEGNSAVKRDSMRVAMNLAGYKNGYVTIDASDWYIDAQISVALKIDNSTDLTPYKEYYIQHILNRANYYDSLAQIIFKRNIKHTLLIHHSLLNALFLNDLLIALKANDWQLIDAESAFDDPVFSHQPLIEPCGESIIWQLAVQFEELSKNLRYPAEDGTYEKEPLNKYLNEYNVKNKSIIQVH